MNFHSTGFPACFFAHSLKYCSAASRGDTDEPSAPSAAACATALLEPPFVAFFFRRRRFLRGGGGCSDCPASPVPAPAPTSSLSAACRGGASCVGPPLPPADSSSPFATPRPRLLRCMRFLCATDSCSLILAQRLQVRGGPSRTKSERARSKCAAVVGAVRAPQSDIYATA